MNDAFSSKLFYELTRGLPRQGPGSAAATRRALAMTRGLPNLPRILDVGCGPGAQTIELALATGGTIVAVDRSARFLAELKQRARAAGVGSKIKAIRASMFDMEFAKETFDLIWSEGAIYIRGFAAGLSAWRRFLRAGGWIAVSELSWLVGDPPTEPRKFWARSYPRMQSVESNRAIVTAAGYVELQTFVLPAQDWWDNYYGPGEARVGELRTKYSADTELLATLNEIQREYDLF
ncbi:MAG: class I SAM-dependent methyltransferase, partial [Candidatus Binataceae bacterium]